MAGNGSFRPPKWCCTPRSPERHRQTLRSKADLQITLELLDKSVYTIGRHESADLQLKGDLVSRMHAAVLQDVEGKRYLVDLKSTHGTYLDAKRLQPHVPLEWPAGSAVHFGTGSNADILVLEDQAGAKRRRTEDVDRDASQLTEQATTEVSDPMAALYGDLPEAALLAPPEPETAKPKLQPLPPPDKDPRKVLFLDIDGVLRPLHSRQDAWSNTRTIEINGARVPLLGNSEAKAGVDFWPSAMRALRFIIQKTGAVIVLSSDWRKSEELIDGIQNALEEYDMPSLYSQTPDLDQATAGVIKALHTSFREKRCKEIRKWLRQHAKVERWCVVDDIDLSVPDKEALRSGSHGSSQGQVFMDSASEFVKTNPAIGLTMDIAKLAICFINGTEPSEEIFEAARGPPPGAD